MAEEQRQNTEAEDSWKTPSYRQSVVNEINQEIEKAEKHIFSMSKSEDEYLSHVVHLSFHIRRMTENPGCNNDWRSTSFRQRIVKKITKESEKAGASPTVTTDEMESHIFSISKCKDNYMDNVNRLLTYIREMDETEGETEDETEDPPIEP